MQVTIYVHNDIIITTDDISQHIHISLRVSTLCAFNGFNFTVEEGCAKFRDIILSIIALTH